MNMETYYKQFENCLQEEKPFCSDDCPFHMDVLDFIDKMSQKRYSAAYKIFRNAAAFPDIVAALCPEYCGTRCPAQNSGGAVQLGLLEKTCIAMTKRKDPNEYNLPPRKGRIAIIGAGLSGLSCALRLAARKYRVVIYEKADEVGGQLRKLLPREVYMEDINRQFMHESYTLHLNTEICDLQALLDQQSFPDQQTPPAAGDADDTAGGFDAVYVATGLGGNDFGTLRQQSGANDTVQQGYCFLMDGTAATLHGKTAVYAGGSLLGKDVICAASDGLAMAKEIEGFLKTGILRYPAEKTPSRVVADTNALSDVPPVSPSFRDGTDCFTEAEAQQEISRCIRCQCNACRTHCDLTAYFDKWPLQMRDEIMTTTMPANSMIRKAPAIRLINMCTQCGLCNETCPGQIELGHMIRDARKILHKIDRMPGAYHQFWVRDMEFANGEYAALAKCPPEKTSCSYAFFPGCHLGASDPRYVKDSYSALRGVNEDVGLLLRCCGVPADWAGNEEKHLQELESLRNEWIALGKPTMIMACPSCMRHFREYLPEIPQISLYEIFDAWHVPLPGIARNGCASQDNSASSPPYALFDPCAARNNDAMQDAVRSLLSASGTPFEELPGGTKHGCCGFGGNGEIVDPKFTSQIRKERISLSDNPYITYCINCRDIFHDEGKPVRHILDILLGVTTSSDALDALPTVTMRRCNRVSLKEALLEEIWSETMNKKPELKYNLVISPEIRDKMNRLKLLEEDICHVLEMGEVHGRRAFDPKKNTYTCYREIGRITCWAEYRPSSENQKSIADSGNSDGTSTPQYEICNVYTHRMRIELEVVFNGRKTDHDLR